MRGEVGQRGLQQLGGNRDVAPAVIDRFGGDAAEFGHGGFAGQLVAAGGAVEGVTLAGQGEHQGAQVEQVPGEVSGAAFPSAELLQRPLGVDGEAPLERWGDPREG